MKQAIFCNWILIITLLLKTGDVNAQVNKSSDKQQINPKQGEIMLGVLNKKPDEISRQENRMMIRIAEIEIEPNDIASYKAILKEEAEASVRLEPGVLAIFPMSLKEDAGKVRILEIYQSQEAYQQHLKSPHFVQYKTSTQKMVKSLKLVDMNEIDTDYVCYFHKITN